MPLLMPCEDLQPGMQLNETFMFRGRVMLSGKKILTRSDVDVLRRQYPDTTLKVSDPIFYSLTEFENDARDRDVTACVTHQIRLIMADVRRKFGQHTNLSGIDFPRIKNAVASVVEFLRNNPESTAQISRTASTPGYPSKHAGNVFYLSMLLGAAVQDYLLHERQRHLLNTLASLLAIDLKPLGLGAMFFDVAMAQVPHFFDEQYQLTAADFQYIREHPRTGEEMLPDTLPPLAKLVVRGHHETYDGTGYPGSWPMEQQHVFVRIVRICDAFDAATSRKFFRAAKSPTRALWEMSYGPYRNYYDPTLVKVFLSIIQPFPIGTVLTLEDGYGAVVTKYNHESPFTPWAVVMFDPYGERLTEDELLGPRTVGEGFLKIKRAGMEDLSFLNEAPPELAERPRAFSNFMETAYP